MVPEWDLNGSPFKALAATFCITCVIMEAHLDTEPAVRESRKPARGLPCSPFLASPRCRHMLLSTVLTVSCSFLLGMPNRKWGQLEVPSFQPLHYLSVCLFFLGVGRIIKLVLLLSDPVGKATYSCFLWKLPMPCTVLPSLFLKKNVPFPVGEGDRCWTNTQAEFVDLRKEHAENKLHSVIWKNKNIKRSIKKRKKGKENGTNRMPGI